MSSAAEIVFFPVKPNINASEILFQSVKIHPACQKGFQAAFHGSLVEDEKIHCLALVWEDRAALETWVKEHDVQAAKETYTDVVNMEAGLEPFISESRACVQRTSQLMA